MSPVNLNTMLVLFHGKLASGGEGGHCIVTLTPSMAVLTLSSLIRPTLNRFSTSSMFVEPEQYHAMESFLLGLCLKADLIALYVLFMQGTYSYAQCWPHLSSRNCRNGKYFRAGVASSGGFGDYMFMSQANLYSAVRHGLWMCDIISAR